MTDSVAPAAPFALPGLNPCATHIRAEVVEQVRLAQDTFRVRIECPEIAARVVPGQFFMIREPGTTQPLLGRPFALYDTWLGPDGAPRGIDVVFLVVGRMTTVMSGWRAGDAVELWGPLGNGFPVPEGERLLMVAGGIGNTPFLATGREALGGRRYGTPARGTGRPVPDVRFLYGARSAAWLAGLEDFESAGIPVEIATDDGSRGHKGFVTDLLRERLAGLSAQERGETHVLCCGPEPMMHAVAKLCAERGTPCWLSLETPMACGFGACFSCVTKVKQGEGWDYRRVCVEGPIFPAEELVWE
jgi:dihydroorotate dehydrogenase electron transfer subunit